MSSSDVATPPAALQRTALHSVHAELGARFGAFAGWELPLYYTSIAEEHQAVRSRVGLFDVSHLAHLEVSGPDALDQLQLLVTQDLAAVEPGRACYTPMLTPKGFILDEMIVYHLPSPHPSPLRGEGAGEGDRFRFVVNAANADKVLAWLRSRLHAGAAAEDLRQGVGTLALQGPSAVGTLEKICPDPPGRLPRYSVAAARIAGRTGWVARTGYTGEDGFEMFFPARDLEAVWAALLEAGKPIGIRPAGLGARDTLRLEAGLPLGGSDLDEKTTPLEAGLEWTVVWRKGPFVGRDALERQRREGITRRLVGLELREPGVARSGYPIYRGQDQIGQVTSGSVIPGTSRAIGLGVVPPSVSRPGTEVQVEIRRRRVKAEIVELPFYRRRLIG